MPRKRVVKVVLSDQQEALVLTIARRLNISQSEVIRTAVMNYSKDLGILQEALH